MTTTPPPSRYRVVERGRRLVVIDTLTGAPAARSAPAAAPAPRTTVPERIAFDGRSTLVTRPFYDDRAPRTVTLDPGATRLVENARSVGIAVAVAYALIAVLQPWVLLLLLIASNPKARAAVRQAITRWLDRYDADTRTG